MGFSVSGLREQSIEEVVALAQRDTSDDSPAMNEIVRRFERKATVIAETLTDDIALRPDVSQAALIGLTPAVRRHQVGRAGFLTYAVKYMSGAARRELHRWRTPMTASLSVPEVWQAACAVAAPVSCPGQRGWGYGRAAAALATLPERQRYLLTDRYVEDKPLGDIAMACGTSVPAVSQRLATAHKAVATLLAA